MTGQPSREQTPGLPDAQAIGVPGGVASQPYVGPQPFLPEQRALFFGRDTEARELLELAVARGVVLLYAQSGAGKTSLINAGLRPMLDAEGYEVLTARLRGRPVEGLDPTQVRNPFVFNTLLWWADDATSPADLTETTVPEFLERASRRSTSGARVMIFDQFEEIFAAFPERWKDRAGFFEELAEALNRDRLLRAMFVIREEYVAQFDAYASVLPGRVRTRVHLESLRMGAALEAVTGPLAAAGGGREFAEGVAEKLVRELLKVNVTTEQGRSMEIEGEFIEPVQLQVVCQSLWRGLAAGETRITEAHLRGVGDINEALGRFYEESIEKAAQAGGINVAQLRRWFQSVLITPAGTRGTFIRGWPTAGNVPDASVEVLENLHLIRGEWVRGARWYELAHDRFIEPIVRANERWKAAYAGVERTRQELEKRSSEWAAGGRPERLLLKGPDLIEAEQWLQDPNAVTLGINDMVLTLVTASRDAAKREEERQRWLKEQAKAARKLRRLARDLKAERNRAALQAECAFGRELAAAAFNCLSTDAECGIHLALHALQITFVRHKIVLPEIVDVLAASVQRSAVRRTLTGHASDIRSVCLSPDGSQVLTASDDKTAILWDSDTGAVVRNFPADDVFVVQAAFHPGGTIVATAGGTMVRLWKVSEPEPLTELATSTQVWAVAFDRSGTYIAAGMEDGRVMVWDCATGRLIADEVVHKATVTAVAFSPDGKTLATASKDKTISLRSSPNLKAVRTLTGHENPVQCLAFDETGARLFTGAQDYTIRVWDVAAGSELQVLRGHSNTVFGLAYEPESGTLVSGSADSTVKLWNLGQRQEAITWTGHRNPVTAVAVNGPRRLVATSSWDATAKIWTLAGHRDAITEMAFDSAAGRVFTASRDGSIRVWDIASGEQTGVAAVLRSSFPTTIKYHARSSHVLAGTKDGTVEIWPAAGGERLATAGGYGEIENSSFNEATSLFAVTTKDNRVTVLSVPDLKVVYETQHQSEISSVRISPDGSYLAVGLITGPVSLVHLASARTFTMEGHDGWVRKVLFTPDNGRVVSCGDDATIRVWNVEDGTEVSSFIGHTTIVFGIALSDDGRLLVSSGGDRTARIWDVATGAQLQLLTGHGNFVYGARFSPNAERVVTAGADLTARVWDTETGAEKLSFRHPCEVEEARFSPDGTYVVTRAIDRFLRIYGLDVNRLMSLAQSRLTRELTDDERHRFLRNDPSPQPRPSGRKSRAPVTPGA